MTALEVAKVLCKRGGGTEEEGYMQSGQVCTVEACAADEEVDRIVERLLAAV